ncbi:MAG TPA: energy transducer TonB [Vicinamibacterales bacterium]|nr:energy transducer TonB [Vicinamibacterales bacterium]
MTSRLMTIALVWAALGSAAAAGQSPIDTVHEFYADANYEAALGALDRLDPPAAVPVAIEMDQIRVLCLTALGRASEADAVIERIITADPAFEPGDDIPPRVRAAFDVAQRRVLPRIARELYAEGKAAYDGHAYADAVRTLERSLAVIGRVAEEDEASLTDLRVLGEGFVELSRAAIARDEPPPPPAAPLVATPASAPPEAPREAIPIRQDMPPWKPPAAADRFTSGFSGVIEVDIDETGAVTAARIVDPSYPAYDALLLEAARAWRYEPARRNGQPAKSTRRVGVVLAPR